jgi:hypothetical protein
MWAALSAGASLTPSPVIATKCHFFLRRLIMINFSSGATLAIIFVDSNLSNNSCSDKEASSSPRRIFWGFLSPISLAMCCAVSG